MTTITINNTAGGDLRRFRAETDASGRVIDVSAAAIRHARRQGAMGYSCSDTDASDLIDQYLADATDGE